MKREPVNSERPLYDTSPRSTVLSKTFTAVSEQISYESKNTCKGASGDKTGKHGKYASIFYSIFNVKMIISLISIVKESYYSFSANIIEKASDTGVTLRKRIRG